MLDVLFWIIVGTYIYFGLEEIMYENDDILVQNFNNLEMETIREQED